MIKLKVGKYCENCPHFVAEQKTKIISVKGEADIVEHRIYCTNVDKCANLLSVLREEIKKEGAGNGNTTSKTEP